MPLPMNEILEACVTKKASDIHLEVGRPVSLRIHGELESLDETVLVPADTEAYMKAVTSDSHRQRIEEVGGVDFGFAYEKKARFRVSAFKQKGKYGLVMRQISNALLSLPDIGLPDRIVELLKRPRGLILCTGPTGSGKSTTLASMVNWINENRACHIITVEDPIEFYHEHKKSIVIQREVGVDVKSFGEALVKALRQDPDIILVGEMRDLQTMEAAISAAETGHLVFGTLHTTGAAKTVDRIVDAFPTHQQGQIRAQLSTSLIAVVSQALISRADRVGRICAFEIMITTPAIANLIRENKTYRITSDIQTGAKYGMITMDTCLLNLYGKGAISYESMMTFAYDPEQVAIQAQVFAHAKGGKGGPAPAAPAVGASTAAGAAEPAKKKWVV